MNSKEDSSVNWPNDLTVPSWNGEIIIPSRIVVETVFGCNARCPMCVIDNPTKRSKGVMPIEKFKLFVNAIKPYRNHITKFDLFGLGEPLLDKYLVKRIVYLKDHGFKGVSISTNGHLLNDVWQKELLDAEIDTVLFSIDGVDKKTHEDIRLRVNYDLIMKNIIDMINLRDKGAYKTRFIVRFVEQLSNTGQWLEYRHFWKKHLNDSLGDLVLHYKMHNWSGQINDGIEKNTFENVDSLAAIPCHHLFEKLVVLADGDVALCFEDLLEGKFGLGNVFKEDPIQLFNSKPLNKLRKLHLAGKRSGHSLCGSCTVLNTENNRIKG